MGIEKAGFSAAVGSWDHFPVGQLFQQAARSGGEVWLSRRD
jgi:hypothetical protein